VPEKERIHEQRRRISGRLENQERQGVEWSCKTHHMLAFQHHIIIRSNQDLGIPKEFAQFLDISQINEKRESHNSFELRESSGSDGHDLSFSHLDFEMCEHNSQSQARAQVTNQRRSGKFYPRSMSLTDLVIC
jgi:hypothetical protein